MIRLDMPDGTTFWVNPDHIVMFFDDPEPEYDDEHVALVKLTIDAIFEQTLLGVIQSSAELKHMIWKSKFDEVPEQ